MASYDWITIEKPEDYEQLLELLDGEFEPRRIVKRLKAKITSRVKAVLVEHDYIDKDYRSTLYNFYAKKGRPYRADCVRLHFFDEKVDFEVRPSDQIGKRRTLDHHYYGYIVLRPTIRATLGRSVLSPDIRVGAHGSAIQGQHYVHLLGHRLSVWGFPSMDQHVDIAACAHVACWAVLRHYSQSYSQYREYLVYEIAKLATGFEPGGISPSRGLDVWEAERVFNAAGCFPIIVGRNQLSSPEEFFGQLLAYMESGFPLFIGMDVDGDGHAIVAAGHNWKKGAVAATNHVWGQVDTLLTVDDNLLPLRDRPGRPGGERWRRTGLFDGELRIVHRRAAGEGWLPGRGDGGVRRGGGIKAAHKGDGLRTGVGEPASVLHDHNLGASALRAGERVTARQDARGTHNAAGYGAVRVGLGVFERGAMGWWTSGSTRHRRCIGESQGSGPYLAAAQRGGSFRVRPVEGGTCCADSWSQSTW